MLLWDINHIDLYYPENISIIRENFEFKEKIILKSYIKIYGPPILKAIRALEKAAIDMPEVCIWDTLIEAVPMYDSSDVLGYFQLSGVELPSQRCSQIISKSGEKVGEYNFYFEWFKNPTQEELNVFIEKIDNALTPIGCRYTITTK